MAYGNYQLPMGMFDPNSEWAQRTAAQVLQQQQAQQNAQQAAQEMAQAPQPTTPQAQSATPATQPATPPPQTPQPPAPQPQEINLHPEAVQMPDSNGLAASAAKVLTPLDDAGRALASQIANFKMKYNAAQKAGDAEGMKAAHEGAQALRDAATSYGLDPERLGANQSYDQLMASLSADYAKGVSDIANMLTPQEYYQQQYQQNLANGMSKRHAQASALDATDAYEGRYKRELGNAFTRYGVNDNGEMNRFGAQIANLMYGNNPQSVALYDQYYANPMQQWKFNKNMEVQDKLYGQKVDFGQHQFDWNRQLNNDNFNFKLLYLKNQGDINKSLLETKMYYDQLSQDKQRQFLVDHPELAAYVMGKGGKNSNGQGTSNKEENLTQTQQDRIDKINNLLAQAQSALDDKTMNNEADGKVVESVRASLQDMYDKGEIPYADWVEKVYPILKSQQTKYQNKYGYK